MEQVSTIEVGGVSLPTLRDFADFCRDTGFNPGTWKFDAPCGTGKANALMDVLASAHGGGWITTPPTPHPTPPMRHRHRRANFNKHARHTKRPNGRPKHR